MLREFAVPVTGLKEGRHKFEFEIEDTFFDHFTETEIHKGLLHAVVQVDKGNGFLEMEIGIAGTVEVICDRCLEPFRLPVDCTNRLYVRFGERSYEQTDEVVVLATGENELNMSQYFYEFIHLALPYSKVHSLVPGGICDKSMLARLRSVEVDRKSAKVTDPRWDQLRKLI